MSIMENPTTFAARGASEADLAGSEISSIFTATVRDKQRSHAERAGHRVVALRRYIGPELIRPHRSSRQVQIFRIITRRFEIEAGGAMSNHGVVAISRGIWDHPIFAPEPFTEREAWQWLIHQAAWRPTKTRPGRALMDLERGQLAFATRFMATKWKWTETRVRRFLRRLESDAMVIVQPTRNATRITVCNYNRWQFGGRIDDAPTNAPPARPRRKEEESKTSKKEESSLLRSEDSERVREEIESGNKHTIPADIEASLIEPTLFMRLWKAYPSRG